MPPRLVALVNDLEPDQLKNYEKLKGTFLASQNHSPSDFSSNFSKLSSGATPTPKKDDFTHSRPNHFRGHSNSQGYQSNPRHNHNSQNNSQGYQSNPRHNRSRSHSGGQHNRVATRAAQAVEARPASTLNVNAESWRHEAANVQLSEGDPQIVPKRSGTINGMEAEIALDTGAGTVDDFPADPVGSAAISEARISNDSPADPAGSAAVSEVCILKDSPADLAGSAAVSTLDVVHGDFSPLPSDAPLEPLKSRLDFVKLRLDWPSLKHWLESASEGRTFMVKGGAETRLTLKKAFAWPRVHAETGRYGDSCPVCPITFTAPVPKALMGITKLFTEPLAKVTSNPALPTGRKFFSLCVDLAIGYPDVVPLTVTLTKAVAQTPFESCSRVGFPEYVTSDNGNQSTRRHVEVFRDLLAVKNIRTSTDPVQSNGAGERYKGTLEHCLRRLVMNMPRQWKEDVNNCIGNPILQRSHQDPLKRISEKYGANLNNLPGVTITTTHHVSLTDPEPFRHSYNFPHQLSVQLKEGLDVWVHLGMVVRRNSPWCSLLLAVHQRDGSRRFCLDCSKYNSRTIFDGEPIADARHIVVSLSRAHHLSKMGLDNISCFSDDTLSCPQAFSQPMRRALQVLDNILCSSDDTLSYPQEWTPALAVFVAIKHFEVLLYSRHFGHCPLLDFQTADKLNQRLRRWALLPQPPQMYYQHVDGVML